MFLSPILPAIDSKMRDGKNPKMRDGKNLKTANARDNASAHNVHLLELTMTLSSDNSSVSWNRLNGGAVWHSRKKLPRSPVDVPECDANAGFWEE